LPTSVRAEVRSRLDVGDVPDDIVAGVDLTVDPSLGHRPEPQAEEVV
jgi:hypothetical protein